MNMFFFKTTFNIIIQMFYSDEDQKILLKSLFVGDKRIHDKYIVCGNYS